VHVICRVDQAKYVIRILVAAPQEYVNTSPTRRIAITEPSTRLLLSVGLKHV